MQTRFETKDINGYKTVVDSLLALVTDKFVYVSKDSSGNTYNRTYDVDYITENNKKLEIRIQLSQRDGNKDLNVPYVNYYNIVNIKGDYQTLFPFWKKYFQANAEFEQIYKGGNGKLQLYKLSDAVTMTVAFLRGSGSWDIVIKQH